MEFDCCLERDRRYLVCSVLTIIHDVMVYFMMLFSTQMCMDAGMNDYHRKWVSPML